MAKGKALVRRNREYWAEIVAQFEKGTLKRQEFCEQRGLEAGTFLHWLYKPRGESWERQSKSAAFRSCSP